MMHNAMCTDKVLREERLKSQQSTVKSTSVDSATDEGRFRPAWPRIDSPAYEPHADFERMLQYKRFAVAFTYPDAGFAEFFSEVATTADQLALEHDRLFRAKGIWLYGAEHVAENEFQRAQLLADIMGFYRAFGLEPGKDRPDALACEFEFMHFLIYKHLYALENRALADATDKAAICFDAQRKFFAEHLYPAAKKVASAIAAQSDDAFYRQIGIEMLAFLEVEAGLFEK